jgi:hypothetical protein
VDDAWAKRMYQMRKEYYKKHPSSVLEEKLTTKAHRTYGSQAHKGDGKPRPAVRSVREGLWFNSEVLKITTDGHGRTRMN